MKPALHTWQNMSSSDSPRHAHREEAQVYERPSPVASPPHYDKRPPIEPPAEQGYAQGHVGCPLRHYPLPPAPEHANLPPPIIHVDVPRPHQPPPDPRRGLRNPGKFCIAISGLATLIIIAMIAIGIVLSQRSGNNNDIQISTEQQAPLPLPPVPESSRPALPLGAITESIVQGLDVKSTTSANVSSTLASVVSLCLTSAYLVKPFRS